MGRAPEPFSAAFQFPSLKEDLADLPLDASSILRVPVFPEDGAIARKRGIVAAEQILDVSEFLADLAAEHTITGGEQVMGALKEVERQVNCVLLPGLFAGA
jgi:hypothetical protein